MVFSSLTFLFIFLPIFLILYYLVPFRYKNIVLLIFSLLFYSFGEPIYLILLLFISILNYCAGLLIDKYKENKKRKFILIISIIINLLLLVIFKYSGFIVDNINTLGLNLSRLDLRLPLGISFFTFQAMSYSIDVYNKKVIREKSIINFIVYVSMFPQLIAGPIVRYEDVAKELKYREITFNNFYDGMFIFLTGLFKKVLIANNVGYLFSLITGDISNISLACAWLGVISFTLHIYFDFSGYSDMAIGLGRMMGFNYPQNFNYPYISTSVKDFWSRWHITLSSWFKNYLYIPLGGNRCSKIKYIRNILIVWFLTGFWHGASWNFILWGLYFGILLLLEKMVFKKIIDRLPKFFRHIYLLFIVLISWTIFAFDDLSFLLGYFNKMFNNNIIFDNSFIFYIKNYYIFLITGIIFSTPIVKKIKMNNIIKFILIIIYILLFILTISSLISDSYNPFLYFRF